MDLVIDFMQKRKHPENVVSPIEAVFKDIVIKIFLFSIRSLNVENHVMLV